MFQPCQNVLAADKCPAYSQFLTANSTLDFTRNPPEGKGTWHFLPTTLVVLTTDTKHFDRAVFDLILLVHCHLLQNAVKFFAWGQAP